MFASNNFARLAKQHQLDPPNPRPPKRQRTQLLSNANSAMLTSSTSSSSSSASSSSSTSAALPFLDQPIKLGELTSFLALDCEMVGVGEDGARDQLARCTLINSKNEIVFDRYVLPQEKVVNYRTEVSGITKAHLTPHNSADSSSSAAEVVASLASSPSSIMHLSSFKQVQAAVKKLIDTRILIGHSIRHDLQALQLKHPPNLIRDTARWKFLCPERPRALKTLVFEQLAVTIQEGSHDSVEDARATMKLYLKFRKQWEAELTQTRRLHGGISSPQARKSQKAEKQKLLIQEQLLLSSSLQNIAKAAQAKLASSKSSISEAKPSASKHAASIAVATSATTIAVPSSKPVPSKLTSKHAIAAASVSASSASTTTPTNTRKAQRQSN